MKQKQFLIDSNILTSFTVEKIHLWKLTKVVLMCFSCNSETSCFRAFFITILVKNNSFAWFQLVCDQLTNGWTDGPTDGHTLLQRCENASKNDSVKCDWNSLSFLPSYLSYHLSSVHPRLLVGPVGPVVHKFVCCCFPLFVALLVSCILNCKIWCV